MSGPSRSDRQALGARLRELRLDAGLSGRDLAERLGWHYTKVSKFETGTRSPSEEDIRAWCAACGAGDQAGNLIAIVRDPGALYREYARQARSGLRHIQESAAALYDRTALFRIYETTLMPGLLATAGYTAAVVRFWSRFLGADNDTDAAVAARTARQRVLRADGKRFSVVLEEQVLRTRVGDAAVMADQLSRLLAAMSLPGVSVAIIPAASPRHCLTQGSFWMFDDTRVHVETVSAGLTITQPREITLYAQAHELLRRSAVRGPDARRLIARALRDLGAPGDRPEATPDTDERR